MKMRSMALSKTEAKERTEPCMVGSSKDGPRYPYGLEIRLENDALAKLDMPLPKVGSYVKVRAECCVTSVSSNEHQKGKPNRSVTLQIERLAVDEDEPESMEEAIEKGVREA